ncbi:hypothetical protein Q4I32_001528 [Leishmania shawi]|uniref:Uncharacterized protein n=1 Tax=Leishmania shawi TaxID=5680 RepID=A0AAW3C687_9TRYP
MLSNAPPGDGDAHSADHSTREGAREIPHTPSRAPPVEKTPTEASATTTASPSSPLQGPSLIISTTPTPPLAAQDPLAARRPAPHVSPTLASVTDAITGAGALAAVMVTADTVANPIARPSCEIHTSNSTPVRCSQISARAPKARTTALVSPQPVLLRNPYSRDRPCLVDAPHNDGNTSRCAYQHGRTSSSHADVEALLSRQNAVLYDACVTRLRVVRQERRVLTTTLEASKKRLEGVKVLLDARSEKPRQPPATAQTEQAEKAGEVREPQSSNSPRTQETEKMVRQLRALDRANDELRRHYEALEREKKHCLTVHKARLRRVLTAAAPSSTTSRRPSAAAVWDESRGSTRSATFARDAQTLDTRLTVAMAQQQALRQELELVMAKERGRMKALTDLQARDFASVHAPDQSGSAITTALRKAAA